MPASRTQPESTVCADQSSCFFPAQHPALNIGSCGGKVIKVLYSTVGRDGDGDGDWSWP
jgi:hypothetical protein